MKILGFFWYYKPASVYGGPVNSMATMFENFVSLGAEATVFATNVNGKNRLDVPLKQPVNVNGVQVWYYPITLEQFSLNYSREMTKALSTQLHQFDIVISGALWQPLLVSIIQKACARTGIPYVVPLYGQLLPWALNYKGWKKKAYLALFGKQYLNHAAALQCTDSSEVEAVNRLALTPPTLLNPYSVKASNFSVLPPRGLLRQKFGIDKDAVVLLVLGRLHRVKRLDIALEILADLNRRDVHLIYAGYDEQGFKPLLEKQSLQMGCQDQVHFTGTLDKTEILQAFADADLLVMPSEQENFGMSAAEALAAGVPVLTSIHVPVGVSAAQFGAGRTAECTREAFGSELKNLLQDMQKLKNMGRIGKEFVSQHYNSLEITSSLLANYAKIVSGNIRRAF